MAITIKKEEWPQLGWCRYEVDFPLQKNALHYQTKVLPKQLALAARDQFINKAINETLTRFVNQRKKALANSSSMARINQQAIANIENTIRLAQINGLNQWRVSINKIEIDLLYLAPKSSTSRFYKWYSIIQNIIQLLKP